MACNVLVLKKSLTDWLNNWVTNRHLLRIFQHSSLFVLHFLLEPSITLILKKHMRHIIGTFADSTSPKLTKINQNWNWRQSLCFILVPVYGHVHKYEALMWTFKHWPKSIIWHCSHRKHFYEIKFGTNVLYKVKNELGPRKT